MARSRIVMLTGNDHKAAEYRRILGRYAVRPAFVAPEHWGRPYLDTLARSLLDDGAIAVVNERSDLFSHLGAATPLDPAAFRHMDLVHNIARATVWRRGADGTVGVKEFAADVAGYLDLHAPADARTFGWDAVFTPLATGISYDRTARRGIKNSARDLVMAEVIRGLVHFEAPVDLNFRPLNSARLVDFARLPTEHLAAVPWLHTDAFRRSPVNRLLGSALQDGVFFRTSQSRRERNYWLPGLNGGIPLVPKPDDIHEITFQFHDLMHAVMPDLVYDGSTGEAHRRVYMLHRMLGEAVSLVAADALFVGTLVEAGCAYDFAKRRIHPLFASLEGLRGLDPVMAFKRAAHANTRFALLGDDRALRALGADPAALDGYKEWYERFFIEDYRWTAQNFARMTDEAALFAEWSQGLEPVFAAANVVTLDEFTRGCAARLSRTVDGLAAVPLEELADTVFDRCWALFWERALGRGIAFGAPEFDADKARSNAFLRYMLGQSVMYQRYAHVPAVAAMGGALRADLVARAREGRGHDADDIARARDFHDAAVDRLRAADAISNEEVRLFKEVVPVFDPFFVSYDADKATPYASVRETVAALFG